MNEYNIPFTTSMGNWYNEIVEHMYSHRKGYFGSSINMTNKHLGYHMGAHTGFMLFI